MYRICAIAKNEQPYLEEWIKYHLSIGFDDITIIEDYGSDSHREITDKFPVESVHLIPAEEYFGSPLKENDLGWQRQIRAYNRYNYLHRGTNDWVVFLDIDEYVSLDKGETLDTVVKYLDEKDIKSLALYWKVYNANGYINPPKSIRGGYTKTITYTAKMESGKYRWDFFSLFKSFIKLTDDPPIFNDVHTVDNLADINGTPILPLRKHDSRSVVYDKIHIDHYFTKSWSDWCRRIKRGNMHVGLRQYEEFFLFNEDLVKYKDKLMKNI